MVSAVRPVLWIALVALLTLAAYLAFSACGMRLPIGLSLDFCAREMVSYDSEALRGRQLERTLVQLERELATRPACPAAEPEQRSETPEPFAEARPECPVEPAPRFAILLDASPSMRFDYTARREDVERLDTAWRHAVELEARLRALQSPSSLLGSLGQLPRRLQEAAEIQRQLAAAQSEIQRRGRALEQSPGEDRIDVARRALRGLVDQIDGPVDLDFAPFSRCDAAPRYGAYSLPRARAALLSTIDGVEIETSTSLAAAIRSIDGLMARRGSSQTAPFPVVLVSDGEDTCDGDPCAAARALKAARPNVVVNVVAIGEGAEEQQLCVAEATGGRVLRPQEAEELADALRVAAGQRSETCQ